MKVQNIWPMLVVAVCCLVIPSSAQQAPDRRGNPTSGEAGRAPADSNRVDSVRGDVGGPARGDAVGPGRPDPMNRPRMPEGVTPEMVRRYMEAQGRSLGAGGQLDAMKNYLDVFDRYSRLSRDPASAGVAAVVTAGEILRARGTDSAIGYFTKVLPDVKNDSVQRAIRLQLVELYKASGQQDKALDQLQLLMTSAPAGGGVGTGGGEAGPPPRGQ
jgi:hypothetical protein